MIAASPTENESAAIIPQVAVDCSTNDRPALTSLIAAMEKLARSKRNEIARLGRRAKAAKIPRIRRLTREVTAEVRRLAAAEAGR
jgi:DNA invertase Pin-like site-specific DNA recombinase